MRDDDHLIVLDKGKIIERGVVREVLARAKKLTVFEAFESIISDEEERLQ